MYSWNDRLQLRIRSGSCHPAMKSHLSKYNKLMPALALLFAAIKRLDLDAVDEESATLAVKWCDYLESHARRIYSGLATPEEAIARLIAPRLANGEMDKKIAENDGWFTARDVYRNQWGGLSDKAQVQAGLELLEGPYWLMSEDGLRGLVTGLKGRPTKRFYLNPKVKPFFVEEFKRQEPKFIKPAKPPLRLAPVKRTGRKKFTK